MSVTYNKNKHGLFCIELLESEINTEARISSVLEVFVVQDGTHLQLTFDEELTETEELVLDGIIQEHQCEDDTSASENDDVATLQMVTTIDLPLPAQWENVDMGEVVLMNTPSIITNGGQTDFVINQPGLYNLRFDGGVDMKHGQVEIKLVMDRAGIVTDIPHASVTKYYDNQQSLEGWGYGAQRGVYGAAININSILQIGDIIRVQARKVYLPPSATREVRNYPTTASETFAQLLTSSSMVVTRMNGPQGPSGKPGKDAVSTLEIQRQGATKATAIEKLNFTGDVTVVDNGDNKATIHIIGSDNGLVVRTLEAFDEEKSEPMLFLVDRTRKDKMLTVDTAIFGYAENTLSNNDWCQVGQASDAACGHIMPFDGVVVRIAAMCEDTKTTSGKGIDLYVNDNLVDRPITFHQSGHQIELNTIMNVPFNGGDKLRLRASSDGNTILDTVIDLYVKWEYR